MKSLIPSTFSLSKKSQNRINFISRGTKELCLMKRFIVPGREFCLFFDFCISKFRGRVIRITRTFAWPGQYKNTCYITEIKQLSFIPLLGLWTHTIYMSLVKLCYSKLRTQRDDLLQDRLSVTKWSRMTYLKIGPTLVNFYLNGLFRNFKVFSSNTFSG
jgi:hypothetical protein